MSHSAPWWGRSRPPVPQPSEKAFTQLAQLLIAEGIEHPLISSTVEKIFAPNQTLPNSCGTSSQLRWPSSLCIKRPRPVSCWGCAMTSWGRSASFQIYGSAPKWN